MWEHKEHPRGTLGKTSKFKGKKFDEIYGSERSDKLKSMLRESTLRQYNSGNFPRQINTSIEKIMKSELIKCGFKENEDFFNQYNFRNKFMCDFAFPKQKVIIECQGDYWHANPEKYLYDPSEIQSYIHLNPIQAKDVKIDKAKKAYIEKLGWTFIAVWESDLENVAKRKQILVYIRTILAEKDKLYRKQA